MNKSHVKRTKVVNALPLPKNPPHGTPSALAEELFEVWLLKNPSGGSPGIVIGKMNALCLPGETGIRKVGVLHILPKACATFLFEVGFEW